MVACTFNFIVVNYRFTDNFFSSLSNTNFHLSFGMMNTMIEVLKKINENLKKAFNFIILLPVYYVFVGLTFVTWRYIGKKEKENKKSYWLESEKSKERYEDNLRQF